MKTRSSGHIAFTARSMAFASFCRRWRSRGSSSSTSVAVRKESSVALRKE